MPLETPRGILKCHMCVSGGTSHKLSPRSSISKNRSGFIHCFMTHSVVLQSFYLLILNVQNTVNVVAVCSVQSVCLSSVAPARQQNTDTGTCTGSTKGQACNNRALPFTQHCFQRILSAHVTGRTAGRTHKGEKNSCDSF